jgi:asparagine synthase (glutamine-hydrolysing)
LIARDPYGIKPLYYADDGSVVRVASQVKALVAGGHVVESPEPAGWVGFLLFGSVPEPYTIYRSVRAVPAGSVVWADSRGVGDPKRYFSVAETYRHAEAAPTHHDARELQLEVREALLDSVKHHLVADVPVGAFLSAGVDSGSLVGLMRDAGQESIQTITLTFDEFRNTQQDEAPGANQIAGLYGTTHTNRIVTEREFQDDLPRILAAMDQPTVDGINTWFVTKAAGEIGLKVAISGLGGDELLGGYSSFRDIPRCVRLMRLPSRIPFLGDAFRTVASSLSTVYPKLSPKSAGLIKYGGDYPGAYLLRRAVFMPWELRKVLDADMVREGLARLSPLLGDEGAVTPPKSPFAKVASMEAAHYMRNQLLRDTDWASMAHSLEVRVPLVDAMLLARTAPLMVGSTGVDGKALLGRSPSCALPESLIRREKTGFATPVAQWLQRTPPLNASRAGAASDNHLGWARRWACQMLHQ